MDSILDYDSTKGIVSGMFKSIPEKVRDAFASYKNIQEHGAASTVRNYLALLICLVPTHAYLAYWYALGKAAENTQLQFLGKQAIAHLDMFFVSCALLVFCVIALRRNVLLQTAAFVVGAVYLLAGLGLSYLDIVNGSQTGGAVFYVVLAVIALSYHAPPKLTVPLFGSAYVLMLVGTYVARSAGVHEYFRQSIMDLFLSAPLAMAVSAFNWHSFVVKESTNSQLKELNDQLVRQRDMLERLIELDELTGLYNRRTFWKICNRDYLKASRLTEGTSSLLLLSIDNFKYLNDTHGYTVGDKILKKIARVFSAKLRVTDVAGRLGGAEFAVFLPETTIPGCIQVAEEIREDIANYAMVFAETDSNPRLELKITVSVGLAYGRAGFMDARGPSLESLYEHSTAALYEAQHPGSNTVNVAEIVYN